MSRSRDGYCLMGRFKTYVGPDGRAVEFAHTIRCRERVAPWWEELFGYLMIARDSDMAPEAIEPQQRNANRVGDTGEDGA